MSKLARFRGGASKAARKLSQFGGRIEGLGKQELGLGHEIVRVGVHAAMALADKNLTQLGPVPVKPSVGSLLAGAGMMMFGKGKTRKLGRDIVVGSLNAQITGFVHTGTIQIMTGPDGKIRVEEVGAPASAPRRTVEAVAAE